MPAIRVAELWVYLIADSTNALAPVSPAHAVINGTGIFSAPLAWHEFEVMFLGHSRQPQNEPCYGLTPFQKNVVAPVPPAHHKIQGTGIFNASFAWHEFEIMFLGHSRQPQNEPCYGLTPL
jgi:hypothetical protein